jgi:putative tryptophan/tyrosine transport system substrate-binding protein
MEQVRRRRVLIAIGAIVAAPVAFAQKATVPRLGLLWLGSPEATSLRNALLEGLRAEGYSAGTSIAIDDRSSVGSYEELDGVVADLISHRPDVIVTFGATASQAAHRATSKIPIVMITGSDPVRLGLVASLSYPGGNVTGFTTIMDLAAKRLELLREAVPRIHQVAVMINPASQAETDALRTAHEAARSLGLASYVAEVHVPDDLEVVFSGMIRAKVDALLVPGSSMLYANRQRIAELCIRHTIPAMTPLKDYADAGALLAYGADIQAVFRQAATYVAKILKGLPPAELPFQQSRSVRLAVNLKTARALGLTVPQSILLRADEVIE